MAKAHKFTASAIPERRTQSLYSDIVADFIALGAESMQVSIEGMKAATLRAGLRRALKGPEDKDARTWSGLHKCELHHTRASRGEWGFCLNSGLNEESRLG